MTAQRTAQPILTAPRAVLLPGPLLHRPERESRSQPGAAGWPIYWPPASSSSANISSELANRAVRVFTISSTSAMALRVCAFGTLSSSGKA